MAAAGRAVILSSVVRGLSMDNSNLPVTLVPGSTNVSLRTTAISNSNTFHNSLLQNRGMHSLLTPRFDAAMSGAGMISNSAYFKRSTQIQRHLNPRPWNSSRSFSTNPTSGGGTSANASILGQLFEKMIQFLARFLPTRAIVEQLEADVDAAAAMVQQGAKIVIEIADEVENLANAAELGAEEVERIAQKVEDVSENIKKIVDDVADVLEGEKGASTLVKKVDQLRKVAAAKKAKEGTGAPATEDAKPTITAQDQE